jgi:hypothetical protein
MRAVFSHISTDLPEYSIPASRSSGFSYLLHLLYLMREILYTVSRNGTPFVKIDPLAEFPSLDTEQSRFVYQKQDRWLLRKAFLVPAPPG